MQLKTGQAAGARWRSTMETRSSSTARLKARTHRRRHEAVTPLSYKDEGLGFGEQGLGFEN